MDNLVSLAENGGRNAKTVLEQNAEGKNTFKANVLTYLIDGQTSAFKQFLCLPQFQIDEILMGCDVVHLFEHPEKMLAVHRGNGADGIQRDLAVIMRLHPVTGRRDALEDLQPRGGFYGLDILGEFIRVLVLHQQLLEQLADDHIRMERRERATAAAYFD